MAQGLYKEWLEPENLLLLQGWKRDGLTDEQIAHNIGINVRTLWKWKAKYGQIQQALKIGKQQANFIIENELFKKARKGNTTAMIFWLKNNWRDKYNDSQLSTEERKLTAERAKKLATETKILEHKEKLLEGTSNDTESLLKDYFDKLESEVNEPKNSIHKETD